MSYLTDIYHATNFEAGHERGCSFGAGADCDCSERDKPTPSQVVVLISHWRGDPHGEIDPACYRKCWPIEDIQEAQARARELSDDPRASLIGFRLRHMDRPDARALWQARDWRCGDQAGVGDF